MKSPRTARVTAGIAATGALLLALSACSGARSGGGAESTAGSGEAEYVLKFSHVTTSSTPKGKAADFFAEELEKASDGRIDVEIYPNSELYGDKDEMQAIQSNAVQMLAPASAKFTTVAPSLQVLDLPFLFDDPSEIPEVASPDTAVGKAIYANEDLEANGMKVIGLWDSGMKQIHSNNETRTPEDTQGKKYRIQPSDVLRSQFEAWGGVPTPLAFAEVYSGLQQGLIDGGENTYSNIESQNMHTVQSYVTESNHGYIGYVAVVNNDWFESLPDDLQTVVEETATAAAEYNRSEAQAVNDESKRVIEEEGSTEIVELTDEERQAFEDLVVPSVYEQYRDVIGDEIIDELLARQEG
ncbi:DctP family TRAP transporter solute-binding subunit [Brevibacterium samyangense]|uniref:TRAP transporter substrate-binding protein n=1 Tax=Brevibacterium samyangense TaxID=366888 RepID=A0ABN2TFA8_9MICO